MPFMSFLEDQSGASSILETRNRKNSWSGFVKQVMRDDSPLSKAERELIGAYVSGLNACQYRRVSR